MIIEAREAQSSKINEKLEVERMNLSELRNESDSLKIKIKRIHAQI